MSGSTPAAAAAAAPAAGKDIKSVLETKPLTFKITTGGASYVAKVHTDRAQYERVKTTRTGSGDSVTSASTAESK